MARAQDTESDNPTGPSGDFNGEVTTAGSYDPFTGCIKRRVTDLTVPGSNGAYPLVFVRTCNSNLYVVSGDSVSFGDGGNWRHSYKWTLAIAAFNSYNGIPTAYSVAYPDGSVITFRQGRMSVPASEYATYWHGPSGTTDRLEVRSSTQIILHTADGGVVNFGSAYHPSTIVDPNGAVTLLTYQPNNANYLAQVTEPGGRWLKFTYVTATYHAVQNGFNVNHSWTLLSQVQASTGQTVTYTEVPQGSQELGGSQIGTVPYYVLTGVTYNYEASISPNGGNVQASYSYNTNTTPPTLLTATDPHYAGAMVNIRYVVGSNSLEEQNLGSSERVSHLDFTAPGGSASTSTETRGDLSSGSGAALTRTFSFGSSNPAIPGDPSPPPSVKPSLLTSATDFEGRTSYKYYYDAGSKDTQGKSFLMSTVDARGNATTYQHEPITGKTTLVTLPDGRTRSSVWGSIDGTSMTNGSATCLSPYYLFQTKDERGQSVIYHRYTNTGLVYQIDYPDGSHEYYSYAPFNGNGAQYYKVSLYQNKLGGQITYLYDETDVNHGGSGHAGLLTSVTRNYGVNGSVVHEKTIFYYDGLDRVQKTVDPRLVTTTFNYNNRHQLTQTTHAADNTSVIASYDDYGNCYAVRDENGHTSTTAYDEYRRVLSVTVPVNAPQASGTQVPSRYQAFEYTRRNGSHAVVSDALSHTDGNWSVSWKPSGAATERIYSPNIWLTDEYDGMTVNNGQNPVAVAPGNGYAHVSETLNPIGQVKTATDAQGFTTTYTYDASNRPATVVDPLGGANHTATNTYYANGDPDNNNNAWTGLLKSVTGPGTDASNAQTVTSKYTSYDQMARLQASTDPAFHNFYSSYDSAGNLNGQTDGAHATGYAYDQLGRKGQITYPDNTVELWSYDASGNVNTYTNRAGAVCTYQYDGRNRCTYYSWSATAAPSVRYEYDAAGRMTRVFNSASDLHFVYDDSGAVIKEKALRYGQSTTLVTTYTHDVDGNVDTILYPHGDLSTFSYDTQERCIQMVYDSTYNCAQHTYYPNGNWLQVRNLPYCGVETAYEYQNNGRVKDLWHLNYATSTNIDLRTYGYAPNGQMSWYSRASDSGGLSGLTPSGSSLENGGGDAYYYNADGSLYTALQNYGDSSGWPGAYSATADSTVNTGTLQLTSGSAPSFYDNFTYDAAGNRTAATLAGQPVSYSDNGAGLNQYSSCGYNDHNGNTTSDGLGWTYAYNANNALVSASGPNGQGMSFDYDGLGRLSGEIVNGVLKTYFYAGSQRIEERDNAGNPVYQYLFESPGTDQILFRRGGAVGGDVWYLYDQFGNTTHLAYDNGAVVEQYLYDANGAPTVYDAAGNVLPGGSAVDNRYLFRGAAAYQWYAPAGLYYVRARFYQPYHGRFLQPDPIGQAGGLNIYTYCRNDPVNGVDPSGCWSWSDFLHPVVQSSGVTPTGTNIPNSIYSDSGGGVSAGDAVNGSVFIGQITYANGSSHAPANPSGALLSGGSIGAVALFWGAGGLGPKSPNLSIIRMTKNLMNAGANAKAYGRDLEDDAVSFLEDVEDLTDDKVSLVGYSRGAVAAIDAANTMNSDGYYVDNLITIDAKSLFGNSYTVPSNVLHSVNIFETNGGLISGLFDGGEFGSSPVFGASKPYNMSNYVYKDTLGKSQIASHTSLPFLVEGNVLQILTGN